MAGIRTIGAPWDCASGRLGGQTEEEEAAGLWRGLRAGFRKKSVLWGWELCLDQGDHGGRGAGELSWSGAGPLGGEVAGALPSGCEAGGSCNACSRGRRHGPPWDESSVRGPVRTRRALPLPPVAFHIPHIPSPVFPRLRRHGWRSWRGPRTWAGVDRRPPPVRRGRSRRAAAAATSTGAPDLTWGPWDPALTLAPTPQLILRHGLAAR